MHASQLSFATTIALATIVFLSCDVGADDTYNVGVARVDITPEYPIRLNGFGNRREESNGVSQRIFAKAIAIGEPTAGRDASPCVLVAIDSLGIRTTMVEEVAKRLKASHNLPPANLAVTFTHSHCTPKVNGACDNIFSQPIPKPHREHIDRYTNELTDDITAAAQKALESMKPSRLDWAVGEVKFAKNRRTAGGPVDHDLPMLIVRDAQTEKLRAVYVSYACHCVTLSFNKISGDWAGYAAELIERRQPGVVAMVSIGAGSDQNPVSGVTGDKVEVAQAQGLEIANEVERLLQGKLKRVQGKLSAVRRRVPLPLNTPPTREQLQAQTGKGRPTDRYNAQTQLERLDRGEPLLSQIDYTIQTWSFGESLCMTFLAGEVCVDYATRLKQELDRDRFWLNTYSNDFCCYIPSERLVREGGYGGGAETPYFALPTTLQAGLEELIISEVLRQAPKAFHAAAGTQGVPPKSPDDSMQCIQTPHDLQVALAAAEPNVMDPVAIDFGPDGRLWVAEMNDYGQDVYASFEQRGRVRWLRDKDNDGFFESSGTYVDGLRFPTDVKVWRDGILICDAPDILFAVDKDQDGKAERVEKLFTGFEIRNAQARVNSLRFGLDGWLYGAGGLFGGKITSVKTGQVVDCSNRDFRIKPDSGEIEPVDGRTQQGRCRNDWNDWFGCSNGSLLRYIPGDDDYKGRSFSSSLTGGRVFEIQPQAFTLLPPPELVRFELSGVPGRATSACGLGIYRDRVLGAEFQNDAFTCEPVHQSVHRIDIRFEEERLLGARGREESTSEFLSSTDRWFRPVQVRTGPDGALWVVDMYRYVIEHSRWIPQDSLAKLDVYAGQGRGRIYRVLPRQAGRLAVSGRRSTAIPDLTQLTNSQLAAKLDSSNGVLRDIVHQLLIWRGAKDAAPELRRVLRESSEPAAQIQTLAALRDLSLVSEDDVATCLRSPNREVQRFAIQVAEPMLDDAAALRSAIMKLANSDSNRVRRQLALSLGATPHAATAPVLAKLLSSKEPSPLVRNAALSSITASNARDVSNALIKITPSAKNQAMHRRLTLLALRTASPASIHRSLPNDMPAKDQSLTSENAQFWRATLDVLDSRLRAREPGAASAADRLVFELFLKAKDALQSDDRDETRYAAAMLILGRRFGAYSDSVLETNDEPLSAEIRADLLTRFLSPRFSMNLQRKAMEAIISSGANDGPERLLTAYPSLSSPAREAVVDQLLSVAGGASLLIDALGNKTVPVVLNASQRSRLLGNIDPKMRAAANKALGAGSQLTRKAAVESRSEAVRLSGSVAKGRITFRKHCANCHRLEEHGHVVGPDLRALTTRDPTWLLTAILDPNQKVDARYLAWTAVTNDGRTATGMIVAESTADIRLREAGGKEHLVRRRELESFQSTQLSLMPVGFERELKAQDLSDIMAYLKSLQSPPKSLPGNQPRLVVQDKSGELRLTAASSELRGGDITFEQHFGNIGWWHHEYDTASWQVEVRQGGRYDIYLDASCAPQAAGNRFRIDGLGEGLEGQVSSTGGWDRYRQFKIGTSVLSPGQRTVVVRPAGPVREALFDLREVRVVPVGVSPEFTAATPTPLVTLPRRAPEIASFLLDESQPTDQRQLAIDKRPGLGPAVLSHLTVGIEDSSGAEQYRRIPWIWRVAIAAGKRNDGGEIRDILELSVPRRDEPLQDWQAVVIGGGLINGATQTGVWPTARLDEILDGLPEVKREWPTALRKSIAMSHDSKVRLGTRYDALRMVAMLEPKTAIPVLTRYLRPGSPRELQMGAVSGLADIDTAESTTLLINALTHLKGRNRQLALEGLLRTDQRARALERQIELGKVVLTSAEKDTLQIRTRPSP